MLRNFCYVVDDVLAGSALPGDWGNLADDLQEARDSGITAIVSLTEKSLPAAVFKEYGLDHLHLPIEDFTPPTMEQVKRFVAYVNKIKEGGKGSTLVHCRAGIGRTGTMLACYLVSTGMSAEDAIDRIRNLRPGSIETFDQEFIVREYAKSLGKS
ncbi:MAG: dual specificity protein phosphatase family protein [Candidatus Sumerlaeia bacterium]|nr:dual specificity protein phosphatase family protein [Candidatus Sumerlaeia bacterium]